MKTTIGSLLAVAALGLSACATYAPKPLAPAADAVLQQANLGALAADARPALPPVPVDFAKPLNPDQLALIAVIANPDLKAARARAKVADAQVFQAGLLPDPLITLGYDNRLSGPDPFNAWTAQLAEDLIAFRDRAVTLRQQRAAARQVRLDIAWQEWQTAGQARLLAARIAALVRIAAIDSDARASADDMLQRVLEAAARGDMKADDVVARRIAAADAADRAASAVRDLDAARHDLNRLLGLKPDTQVAVADPPPARAPRDAEALFQRARTERLDLHALESGYESQEAAVRKAVMDQFNSLQLTVTRAQDTAGNQTLGGQVAFALPTWDRGRGGVALAEATREQLRAEYAARVFAARSDIFDLVGQMNLEMRERAVLEDQLPPLRQVADAAQAAAARGDVSLATAEAARQSVADKALLLATLDRAMAEQSAALRIAVGGPLSDE